MKGRHNKRVTLLISIAVIAAFILSYYLKLPFLESIELITYDFRFLYRGPLPPGNETVLIVIDEKSLDEIGRWQWPRSG